ncbi:uncharacterized protein PAN0_005c2637 [Moesziomyces antarcticus]|uniref:Uncharacterized protein n=2 Tax=Pseudozyma antarctica TaxID=84753 RepID=A0A081CCM7_PSEA2|nr:uncharacterized protein PAN0_005c2637 [Moesziomyces antarcticus]GAK64423.1 hypothetical protein PAN0_005c2637 [Moesziomyces antarcticus]SPO45071.1 uncharacterized protein PSANT_02757 [Moesziomyces antarcticus]
MPDSTRKYGRKRAFLQDPWVRSESEFQLLSGSAPQPQQGGLRERGKTRGSLGPAPLPGLAWLASHRFQAATPSKKPRRSAPRPSQHPPLCLTPSQAENGLAPSS